jgi:hypothetical protein
MRKNSSWSLPCVISALCLASTGFSAAFLPTSAFAGRSLTVAWVDDDGVQAKANNITSYFTNIPDALHAVVTGGTVYVLPGLYNDSAGQISVIGGKSLIAMLDATHQVNPMSNPKNTVWPVIVESLSGNAIQSYGAQQNITIHGFYIRQSAANGIQIQGQVTEVRGVDAAGKSIVTSVNVGSLCNHMTISGNRIESTYMDGVKVTACSDVKVIGNYIRYTSGISATTGAMEQAIDFMMTANSEAKNNLILDNAIGMAVKGGSAHIKIANNTFAGPFLWVAQSGEPVNNWLPYSSATSPQPWGVRDLIVTGNVMVGNNADVALDGCQSCSYVNNTLGGGGFLIKADPAAVTKAPCIQDLAPIKDLTGVAVVATANCPTTFPLAQIVSGTPGGVDIQPST